VREAESGELERERRERGREVDAPTAS